MISFFQTIHCTSHAHCDFCRNNRAWRDSVLKAGLVKEVDFPCPPLSEGGLGLPLNHPVPGVRKPRYIPIEEMKVKGPIIWKRWHGLADLGQFPGHDVEWMAKELPCGTCRTHMRQALARCPFRPDDQAQWMIDFHNEVNATLGKPFWPPILLDI